MLPKGGIEMLMEEEGRRLAVQLGRQEAELETLLGWIEDLQQWKFGAVDVPLMEALRQQTDIELLRRVRLAIKHGAPLEEVRHLLP
jgi:hypothetical protein